MNEFIEQIPKDIINFALIVIFSLLIGLEQHRKHQKEKEKFVFGSDRTFAFTGILGFIFYIITPESLTLYIVGAISLIIFLSIFYIKKIEIHKKFGLTSIFSLLITYGFAPLIYTKPLWLNLLVVTVLLILTELKDQFKTLTKKFNDEEFLTIASFLVMSGVILPLLPDKIIVDLIPISPFKFWLAVVVVSGISYLSYLLQKFVFPKQGILITGFIGGLYSSTATTVVLARKSKESSLYNQISASIVLATTMMFLRIFIIALIFNKNLALILLPYFAILLIICIIISLAIYFGGKLSDEKTLVEKENAKNPLEFKTALFFATLFVIFGIITEFVLNKFGQSGLHILSLVVGVTDIDPFLVSLFTGKFSIGLNSIAAATLIAITSNNVLKMVYGFWFGVKQIRKQLAISYLIIILVGIIMILNLIL